MASAREASASEGLGVPPARGAGAWANGAWCALLVVLAVAVRWTYLRRFGMASQEGGDMEEYIGLARHLFEGHGFTFDGVTPATYRPPLFAWLLSVWCRALGDASLETMVGYQVAAQSLAAPATFLLLLKVQGSRRFSLAAGLFMSLYPYLYSGLSLILQEPTQMLVAALAAMAVASWWRAPGALSSVLAGLLLGLCALSKAPFLAGAPILLLVHYGLRRIRERPTARQAWLVAVVAAGVVVPWTVRNAIVSGGRFVPINAQDQTAPIWMVADGGFLWRDSPDDPPHAEFVPVSGLGFRYGNEDGVDYLERRNEELLSQGARGPAVMEGLARASRAYLVRHPLYVLRLMARGAVLSFVPLAVGPIRDFLAARIAAMVLFHLPLAAGLACGLVRAYRRRDPVVLTLSLLAAVYLLAHTTVANEGGRYAMPMTPILLAVTGYSLFGAPGREGS